MCLGLTTWYRGTQPWGGGETISSSVSIIDSLFEAIAIHLCAELHEIFFQSRWYVGKCGFEGLVQAAIFLRVHGAALFHSQMSLFGNSLHVLQVLTIFCSIFHNLL